MTHWLIAKVDPNKEFIVAKALEQLGHTVWVPTQITVKRKAVSVGPGITLRRREAIERPLMPSVLFVAIWHPDGLVPATRHLQGFWTDYHEVPRIVPEGQLSIFRARVEKANRSRVEEIHSAEMARIKKAQSGRKKATRTFRLGDPAKPGEPSLADLLMAMVLGKEQQEAA